MSPSDSMRAERDELLVALKEVKAENERLRGSSRDHDPTPRVALEKGLNDEIQHFRSLLKVRNRQIETSSKFWVRAAEAALAVLPGASNSTHPAYDLWLRVEMSKMPPMDVVLSSAKPDEGESSRDEVKPSIAKAENR